jgi:lipopolysaccharide biosynthesis glycosyltransferase
MNNAIFLTFNDNYFRYAKNCLNSIEENYPNHPVIIVQYSGENEEILQYLNTRTLLRVLQNKSSILNLKDINEGIIPSKEIFSRYILWTDMFDEYDAILYLDCDTVVLKPLDELFNSKNFFSVYDFSPTGVTLFKKKFHKDTYLKNLMVKDNFLLDLNDYKMMNSGVFLLPKKYRTKEQFDKLWALTERYSAYTAFGDQAAITLWCYSNEIKFSTKIEYNFQACFLLNEYLFYCHPSKMKRRRYFY